MSEWTDETIDWYAKTHGDHPSVAAVAAAVQLAGAEDVLDIGCGTGSALRAIATGTTGKLVGIDPFARMIAYARAATDSDRIDYVTGHAEALPFEDEAFDVVMAINSTSHWTDFDAGMAEALRVLRPVGQLVIGGEYFTEPNDNPDDGYRAALSARDFDVVRHDLPHDVFVTVAHRRTP